MNSKPVEPTPEPLTDAERLELQELKALVMLPTFTAREREIALTVYRAMKEPPAPSGGRPTTEDFTAPLPPRPPAVVEPQRYDLVRYGVTWEGQANQPLLTPMPDGYWTPWHLAVSTPVEPVGASEPPSNWLDRQFKNAAENVKELPSWLGGPEKAAPEPCVWRALAGASDKFTAGCVDDAVSVWVFAADLVRWNACPYCKQPVTVGGSPLKVER